MPKPVPATEAVDPEVPFILGTSGKVISSTYCFCSGLSSPTRALTRHPPSIMYTAFSLTKSVSATP